MVHLAALPGSPFAAKSVAEIAAAAVAEARVYQEAGVDAIMLENMHDVPYTRGVGPETVAAFAAVACAVRSAGPSLPCGAQVLSGANREALAIASATGMSFIRAEGFVFAHVGDEGLIQSCAGELLRYRRAIGAQHVSVFADIKKKHSSHAITADVPLSDTAKAAAFFAADAVIVTGTSTGVPTDADDVNCVKLACPDMPVLVGSGCTVDNVHNYMRADALIVGSHFKVDGHWAGALVPSKVAAFTQRVRQLGSRAADATAAAQRTR